MIRPEGPGDHAAIAALLTAAFDTDAEARLVAALRRDGDLTQGMVAEEDGRVIAYAALSRHVAPAGAEALAPVATAAAFRRQGHADRVIRALLAQSTAPIVTVLGDPAYYGRFGFSAQAAAGFQSPFAGPYLQALPRSAAAPDSGPLEYARAFLDM